MIDKSSIEVLKGNFAKPMLYAVFLWYSAIYKLFKNK